MSARATAAFITDQVEELKQRQFVDLVPGIVQVRSASLLFKCRFKKPFVYLAEKHLSSIMIFFFTSGQMLL